MPNKIVMILIDGMRPDFVTSGTNPHIPEFLAKSIYTMEAQTTMPSVTLPCHSSLFFSVPSERHGILTNTWVPQVRPVRGLVEVLKSAGKSSAFVYDWGPLRDLAQPESLSYAYFANGYALGFENTLQLSAARAVDLLAKAAPDFMFVYIGLPDVYGHNFGFATDKYAEAVSQSWDGICAIAGAASPDYGLVVLADHGGHGRMHGEDIPEDMTIPVILHGDIFKNAEMGARTSIIDVAPTIAAALGAEPDAEWEGRSMYRL
jgi:predicted AlkP superfamily pyrophosphatase or phosphodiesterase